MLVIELHMNFAPWDAVSWYTKFIWINSIKIKMNPDLMGKNMKFYQFTKKVHIITKWHMTLASDNYFYDTKLLFSVSNLRFQLELSTYACSIKSRTLNFNRNFHAHKLNDHFTIDKFGIATFDWHNSRPHIINQYFLEKNGV